jgi:hypothetical protein
MDKGKAITMLTAGVPQYGYSQQSMLVARGLVRDKAMRDTLRAMLDRFDKACTYSNEDCDRSQQAADMLTRIMRTCADPDDERDIERGGR